MGDHKDYGDHNDHQAVPHVLAVDDNLIDRKLVEKLLKNSSCRVTSAESGMKALEYLGLVDDKRNSRPFVPKLESSILKQIPVVIMSSENIPTRTNKCLDEGATMFMLKPLEQSDVKKLKSDLMNCQS